jgi:hypothetical protein
MSFLFLRPRSAWGQPDRLPRMNPRSTRRLPEPTDSDVGLFCQRISHSCKLKRAQNYLAARPWIRAWTKWKT